MSDSKDRELLVGYRVFRPGLAGGLFSQNDFGIYWIPGKNVAECVLTGLCGPDQHIEGFTLGTKDGCGFHMWGKLSQAVAHAMKHRDLKEAWAVGVVMGGGDYVVHKREGVRAEFAAIGGIVKTGMRGEVPPERLQEAAEFYSVPLLEGKTAGIWARELGKPLEEEDWGVEKERVLKEEAEATECLRIKREGLSREELVSKGVLSMEALVFLERAVRQKRNVIILGGIRTGKSTLLGVLSGANPKNEWVTVVQNKDISEIFPVGLMNFTWVDAEMRDFEKAFKKVMETNLQKGGGRLIIDEVQTGWKEVLQLMEDERGVIVTAYAEWQDWFLLNGAANLRGLMAGQKLKDWRKRVGRAKPIVVQMAKVEGERMVLEISEVLGFKDGEYQVKKIFRNEEGLLLEKEEKSWKNFKGGTTGL